MAGITKAWRMWYVLCLVNLLSGLCLKDSSEMALGLGGFGEVVWGGRGSLETVDPLPDFQVGWQLYFIYQMGILSVPAL